MDGETTRREGEDVAPDRMSGDQVVVRRSGQGWQVGQEQTVRHLLCFMRKFALCK